MKNEKRDVVIPTVHLNGTGQEGLEKQVKAALTAVREAQDKLRAMMPHGRDYYVQAEGSTAKARSDHYDRIVLVASVEEDLTAIYLGIVDQRH